MIWRTGRHTPTKNSHVYPPGTLHSFYILSRYDATLTVFVDKHLIVVDSFAEYRYNCNVCMLDFYFISELKNIEKKIHVANAMVRRVCCSGGGGDSL